MFLIECPNVIKEAQITYYLEVSITMREFNDAIFFGNKYAEIWVRALKEKLEKAISIASDLQQPEYSENDKAWKQYLKERQNIENNLEDLIKDIAMGLTGKEIIFKEE